MTNKLNNSLTSSDRNCSRRSLRNSSQRMAVTKIHDFNYLRSIKLYIWWLLLLINLITQIHARKHKIDVLKPNYFCNFGKKKWPNVWQDVQIWSWNYAPQSCVVILKEHWKNEIRKIKGTYNSWSTFKTTATSTLESTTLITDLSRDAHMYTCASLTTGPMWWRGTDGLFRGPRIRVLVYLRRFNNYWLD